MRAFAVTAFAFFVFGVCIRLVLAAIAATQAGNGKISIGQLIDVGIYVGLSVWGGIALWGSQ